MTTDQHMVSTALQCLNSIAEYDQDAAAWACYDWLQINSAGLPYVPLVEQTARADARFWAETASPPELECYTIAAVDKLSGMSGGHAMYASRQIKRLAGALWRRMAPSEKAAFAEWIKTELEGETE